MKVRVVVNEYSDINHFLCPYCHRVHTPPYYNTYAPPEEAVALKLMGIRTLICNPCIDGLTRALPADERRVYSAWRGLDIVHDSVNIDTFGGGVHD